MPSNLKYVESSDPFRATYVTSSMVNHVLEKSHGQQTMSPEDMKIAIVSLRLHVEHQGEIIVRLIEELEDIRAPKKKRWFFKK